MLQLVRDLRRGRDVGTADAMSSRDWFTDALQFIFSRNFVVSVSLSVYLSVTLVSKSRLNSSTCKYRNIFGIVP